MLISQVNSIKNNNYMRYNGLYASKINFRGQLETDYFEASKTGNVQKQLKSISNISFDVSEKDIETQDNFLHVAIRSNNKQLINKALIALGRKDPSLINAIIDETNSDGKKPYEYATDHEVISRLRKIHS